VIYQGMLIPRLSVEEFKLKMREIARIVTAGGGQPVFIINHLQHDTIKQGTGEPYEEVYARYEVAIRALIDEIPVPGIDLPRQMEERQVDLTTFLNDMDGIHLTQEGNRIYGEMVFAGLQALVFTST